MAGGRLPFLGKLTSQQMESFAFYTATAKAFKLGAPAIPLSGPWGLIAGPAPGRILGAPPGQVTLH